jgi:hypothetical protein
MELLRSSIFGKEFINYRRNTTETERKRFYRKTTIDKMIPVVVDSVDKEIIEILKKKSFINGSRVISYGLELEMKEDSSMEDILREIKIELLKMKKEYIFMENDIQIGLEDGMIIEDKKEKLINIYKKHKNEKDNILYLLITKEKTMYNYIMSIIKSLWKMFKYE